MWKVMWRVVGRGGEVREVILRVRGERGQLWEVMWRDGSESRQKVMWREGGERGEKVMWRVGGEK